MGVRGRGHVCACHVRERAVGACVEWVDRGWIRISRCMEAWGDGSIGSVNKNGIMDDREPG